MFLNLNKKTVIGSLLAVPLAISVAAASAPREAAPEDLAVPHDPALTETYCDARFVVAETLQHDFAETPRLAALTGTGMTMELWASDILGTWTLVHHGSDGITCIVTSGHDWAGQSEAVTLMDQVLKTDVHQS